MKHPAMWDAARTLIKLRNQAPPLVGVARSGNLPLSFSQERLWVLNQLNPGTSAYNLPYAFRLKGRLHLPALTQSFNEIRQRHEALRTTFPQGVAGQPVQLIAPPQSLPLPMVDLRGIASHEREAQAMQLVASEAQTPFDVAQGPLFRASVLQLASDEHLLLLTFHHIIFDYWSQSVFFNELATLYGAFSSPSFSQPGLVLPELPIQYPDFAVWQRQWLQQREVFDILLSYWEKQLDDNLSGPLYAGPRLATKRGGVRKLVLPKALTNGLKVLSRQERSTLFTTLLAAFNVLLHHYTNALDLIVCSPIANRNRSELKSLIGYFVNLLILRSDLSGDPSFSELLGRMRSVVSGAVAHQDLPVQFLSQRSQQLSQVMFALLNTPDESLTLPGLTVSEEKVDNANADFDLFLYFVENAGTLSGVLKYNAELFNEASISQLLSDFRTLLSEIVAHPDKRLSLLLKGKPPPLLKADVLEQKIQSRRQEQSNHEALLLSESARQIRQQVRDEALDLAEFQRQLEAATEQERGQLLVAYLQAQVARVLGAEPFYWPETHQLLNELGVDSLKVIELTGRIRRTLGVDVPMVSFIDTSIENLSHELIDILALRSQSKILVHALSNEVTDTFNMEEMEEIVL